MGLCTGFEDTVQHKAVSHVCYLTQYNYSSVIGSVLNRTIVNGSILDRTIVIGSILDRTIVIGSILDDDWFDFILDRIISLFDCGDNEITLFRKKDF